MRNIRHSLIAFTLLACSVSLVNHLNAQQPDFNRQVRPILANNCYQCHGPDAKTRKAELRLDTKQGLEAERDPPLITRGQITKSELIARITSTDEDLRMPPVDSDRKLTSEQIAIIKRWVEQDAVYTGHWSLQPITRPTVPKTRSPHWAHNPIDDFILSGLEAGKLQYSEPASPTTLLRRVTLDLTGLSPTAAETGAFLADPSPHRYEQVVDRLLNSPSFGEHMAWNWLVASRYSDTNGYQGDRTRTSHFWRTWVINAFNDNMPFNQFTVEQLAGDLLENPTLNQQIATGFNRNHPLNGEGGRIAEESRVEYVFDSTETTGTVWLGLTVGCARCHDHKYDPITQKEYYELYAYFNSIDESGSVDQGGNANPVLSVPTQQQRARIDEIKREIQQHDVTRTRPLNELLAARDSWIANIGKQLQENKKADGWQVLVPETVISSAGATTHIEPRGKVVITGTLPKKDDYTVTIALSPGTVEAIRLEALTSDVQGYRGPGRKANFVLTSFEVTYKTAEQDPVPVKLRDAIADFEQGDLKITEALNPAAEKGWGVWQGEINTAQDRQAIFFLEQPLQVEDKGQLILHLRHQSPHAEHVLGCFQISVSDDPDVDFKTPSAPPGDILSILNKPPQQWTGEQSRQVAEYHRRQTTAYREATKLVRLRMAETDRIRDKFSKTMVMRDRAKPRETKVLTVGQYNNPLNDELIIPDTPANVAAMPEDAPKNRLALANWIVSTGNPLTARVAVNRFWQQFFGTGIVKTSEDFGTQGDLPSHPLLLDWLAADFREHDWDVKRLLKMIVMSATYQQTSTVTPGTLEIDPYNRLLSRASRFRLPAHTIRDNVLLISGLLATKLGGPSVKPYQPDGLWADFSFGKIKYQQDSGDALYRRSLYTFWRRSLGPPNMFDEASRQTCSVRTTRTNTPLHALTLLNDITFVEAARIYAQRILRQHSDQDQRLLNLFQGALQRPPTGQEQALLARMLKKSRTYYQANPDSRQQLMKMGAAPFDQTLDLTELAAYTNVANMIFNTDEFVTRE